jgi:hypothetical protein
LGGFARAALESRRLRARRRPDLSAGLDSPRVLDEHLLDEAIRFAKELLVVRLACLPDALELRIRERFPGFAERGERILRLARFDDISHESKEVALACRVGEVSGDSHRLADDRLRNAGLSADLALVLLEKPLMLAHSWNRSRAEVAISNVVRLLFVILEILQQRSVLHRRIADLAFEKVDAFVHWTSESRAARSLQVTRQLRHRSQTFSR